MNDSSDRKRLMTESEDWGPRPQISTFDALGSVLVKHDVAVKEGLHVGSANKMVLLRHAQSPKQRSSPASSSRAAFPNVRSRDEDSTFSCLTRQAFFLTIVSRAKILLHLRHDQRSASSLTAHHAPLPDHHHHLDPTFS